MKIAIFGATGRVGHEVLKNMLADGHEVTALARSPEKLEANDLLTVIQGDVRNEADVRETIVGSELVFSAIDTDKTTTLTESISHIIKVMKEEEINRVVTIGTAGILQSRTTPDKLRYQSPESKRRTTFAAEEHHKVYDDLAQSELDWTIVCPTYLPDGEAVGNYRTEHDYLPEDGKKITVGDTANFAYDVLIDHKHSGFRVGITY